MIYYNANICIQFCRTGVPEAVLEEGCTLSTSELMETLWPREKSHSTLPNFSLPNLIIEEALARAPHVLYFSWANLKCSNAAGKFPVSKKK
jgi:hypothetical protein